MNKALEIACADFVWELPEGLDTVLLEDGEGLSEGQLQRLAVARAVLSERPILLLDEATSALDAETEKALLQNIKKLENKTCLIVTHRPAALDIADNILSVENKKIRVVK
jgi:ATP-binding cassette subfamily B protein